MLAAFAAAAAPRAAFRGGRVGGGCARPRGLRAAAVRMKLTTGIVGCPNVGKSTLMNALVEGGAALAGNYPFCTVEPNVGIAAVPDTRLDVLGGINESAKTVPTTLEFVDIAGLVAGASKGEGLGNKFLASIRECDAIVHVCRCFEDDNIVHVAGSVDPLRDIEVINLELGLADVAQVDKRLRKARAPRGGKSDADPNEVSALEKILPELDAGGLARLVDLTPEEVAAVKPLGLLTMKPVVYAANVADAELAAGNERVEAVREYAGKHGDKVVIVSAQVEAELAELSPEDKAEFLEALDVTPGTTGLPALVAATYELLGLRTYFTSGPTETRAWTITAGMKAPQAAGVIHGDVRFQANLLSMTGRVRRYDLHHLTAPLSSLLFLCFLTLFSTRSLRDSSSAASSAPRRCRTTTSSRLAARRRRARAAKCAARARTTLSPRATSCCSASTCSRRAGARRLFAQTRCCATRSSA